MSDSPKTGKDTAAGSESKHAARERSLAEALRENLRRRKARKPRDSQKKSDKDKR